MTRTSITDAKNNLSALLQRVKAGETVVIEERGVPIATIEPLSGHSVHADVGRMERLEQQGIARRPRGPMPKDLLSWPLVRTVDGSSASAIIIEERRSGR